MKETIFCEDVDREVFHSSGYNHCGEQVCFVRTR